MLNRLPLLALIVTGQASAAAGVAVPDGASDLGKTVCACLQEAPSAFSGQRDGGRAVSLFVPTDFVRSAPDSPDSEELRWTGPSGAAISYSYIGSFQVGDTDFESDEPDRCVLQIRGQRVAVSYGREAGRYAVGLHFEYDDHEDWELGLGIRSTSLAELCTLGANTLWGVAFVNDWRKLKILRIAPDRTWFEYENEIGEKKLAIVGDTVSRDHGVVKSIEETRVVIIELGRDGMGGWREIVRTLVLAPPARPGQGATLRGGREQPNGTPMNPRQDSRD